MIPVFTPGEFNVPNAKYVKTTLNDSGRKKEKEKKQKQTKKPGYS